MAENRVKVIGGPVLGDRKENDHTLVDAVMHTGGTEEDKQLIIEGGMLGSGGVEAQAVRGVDRG